MKFSRDQNVWLAISIDIEFEVHSVVSFYFYEFSLQIEAKLDTMFVIALHSIHRKYFEKLSRKGFKYPWR